MRLASQFIPTALIIAVCSSICLAREDTLEELKAKAQTATAADQAKFYIQIAHLQLGAADKAYAAGQTPEAQNAIRDVASYSEKAGEAALKSGKHQKNTEIELRKMARRLRDIQPTLNVEDRAPVQDAIDRLEHVRSQLLMSMFSKK